MALNIFRQYPGFRNEEWEVPANTQSGVVVIHNVDGRPGITLTARGDATSSVAIPGVGTVSAFPVGGVGNKPDAATVGVEGYDAILAVTGATAGETVGSTQTGTPAGTAVYAVVSSGAVTSLTLTASGNTKIGVVADGRIIGTNTPVSIGVDL